MSKDFAVGVDIGGTATKIALVRSSGRVAGKISIPTQDFGGARALTDAIAKEIELLLAAAHIRKRQVAGAGVGLPGLVDCDAGVVRRLTNVPGWRGVALMGILQRRLRVPCLIDNDANLAALGEFRFGAGKGADDVVCITIGTGVGAGIIIGGKLYRGKSFAAGEIGHIAINEDGPRCNCGSKGCIESYAGNQYVIKEVVRRLRRGEKSKIANFVERLGDITPQVLHSAAEAGDRFAIGIWNEIGTHLGVMLAGVINLLNPERIIIGGGISKAGEFLFGPVRRTIRKRAMAIPAKACEVMAAKLGEDAGIIGAAALVFEKA